MTGPTEHKVYSVVPTTNVSEGQNIVGFRFVFTQKTDGLFKTRLMVQGCAQYAGIDYAGIPYRQPARIAYRA